MLDAAIQDSIQTARASNVAQGSGSDAGPSNVLATSSRVTRAQRIAEVVERRLQQQEYEHESDEDESSDEALADKKKPSKKAASKRTTPVKASKVAVQSQSKVMTLTEMRKARKEQRRLARQNKQEELALRKKLGRRLTPVCIPYPLCAPTNISFRRRSPL